MECSKRKHKLLGLQVVILFLIAGGVLVGKRLVNNNPESCEFQQCVSTFWFQAETLQIQGSVDPFRSLGYWGFGALFGLLSHTETLTWG